MHDDESNWEDIQDPNVPMDSQITLTGEGDEIEVLSELSGVYVSCLRASFLNANTRAVGTDIDPIIVLGLNAFALGRSNGRHNLMRLPMHILGGRLTRPIWKLTVKHLLWST
jgi:hypothetical protein